jgi:hypothetical protein
MPQELLAADNKAFAARVGLAQKASRGRADKRSPTSIPAAPLGLRKEDPTLVVSTDSGHPRLCHQSEHLLGSRPRSVDSEQGRRFVAY